MKLGTSQIRKCYLYIFSLNRTLKPNKAGLARPAFNYVGWLYYCIIVYIVHMTPVLLARLKI